MQGSEYVNPYVASEAPANERATFIRKTYAHLAGAILAFGIIETALLHSPAANLFIGLLGSQYSWLIVLGAFMLVSWVAQSWAQSGSSPALQYAGLGLYVVAESIIFLPIMAYAARYQPEAITGAAIVTLAIVLALTGVVLVTRQDFSFMRGILTVCFIVAFAAIVASIVFKFALPTVLFSSIMVILAGGAILYQTGQIMFNYRTDQHVAASLGLFSSVMLLFWYVLRLFLSRRD